jgi:hypothetical protein
VSDRVRSIVVGLAVGVAVLLLLQLSGILRDAAAADGATSTRWWVLASYAAVGAVVAFGVGMGRSDRLVPALAAVVLLLFVAPSLPGRPLPFGPWDIGGQTGPLGVGLAIGIVAIGALGYATIRGPRV